MSCEVREAVKSSFVPVLLGSNSVSARLSLEIFARAGIISCVFDRKHGFLNLLNPFCRRIKSNAGVDLALCAEELIYFEQNLVSDLPFLIVCAEEFAGFVAENRAILESRYIIADKRSFFEILESSLSLN